MQDKQTAYTFELNPSYSYLSETESAILRSNAPVSINESDEISVLGHRGIWLNKQEALNWKGPVPLNQYAINEDPDPEIITKKAEQSLVYIQELAIRYLKPPSPPAPGDIIINQEANIITTPAPPLIIRQQPVRPATPDPLVIREAPPPPPKQLGRKVITISGKRIPPPPRKVIIERLPPLPSKPQSVIIERWLPYSQVKRRVIYKKSNENEAIIMKPKNVIVQWEAPQVQIKKDFKYLGIIRANPVEYVKRYGPSLKTSKELPEFVLEIKPPSGIVLAADYQYNEPYELEGDVHALGLVDLDREGLSEYKPQVNKITMTRSDLSSLNNTTYTYQPLNHSNSNTIQNSQSNYSMAFYNKIYSSDSISSNFNLNNALFIISEIFAQVDRDNNGKLSISEAEKLFLKLNSRLGRRYGEEDVKRFFLAVDVDRDGFVSLNEFRIAFEKLL